MACKIKKMSPQFSFKGFQLSKNLSNALKNAAYTLIPAIATELVTKNIISATLAGLLGTSICKAIEYYLSEIEIKE